MLGLPREPRADKDVPFRELRVGTQTADRETDPATTRHPDPMGASTAGEQTLPA